MEGQALRDRADEFASADCLVLGASFDSVEENRAFAEEQRFPFPLLSDPDRHVGTSYDVVRAEDDQYVAFPRRVSYLIDADGVIRRAYAVSDVEQHADQVLADLRRLRTET